jgi:hypothetical protein
VKGAAVAAAAAAAAAAAVAATGAGVRRRAASRWTSGTPMLAFSSAALEEEWGERGPAILASFDRAALVVNLVLNALMLALVASQPTQAGELPSLALIMAKVRRRRRRRQGLLRPRGPGARRGMLEAGDGGQGDSLQQGRQRTGPPPQQPASAAPGPAACAWGFPLGLSKRCIHLWPFILRGGGGWS